MSEQRPRPQVIPAKAPRKEFASLLEVKVKPQQHPIEGMAAARRRAGLA